jgi:hypothetical protein
MYDGGKKASVEEWNVEIQRRRVHEETFYPDHQANPPTSLISPTPLTSHPDSARPPTHVQTTASNDAAEANATTLTETGSTSNHESTDEGSLAWSPEGLNGVAPVLNCTTPFGQLEAAQWQT